MKFYYDVLQKMQEYLVTQNEECLEKARDFLKHEIQVKDLQKTYIILDNMDIGTAESLIQQNNVLKLSTTVVTNEDGDIEVDRYIRVIDTPGDFTSALILKVAHLDDKIIILVPFIPMNSSQE